MALFMDGPVFWHWWILTIALLVLEVFVPGTFFLWLGVSAGVVGLLLWLFPELAWEYQALVFALLSVTSIMAWVRYRKRHPEPTDRPALNRRAERYIGRVFTLTEPIVNGRGRISVDDTLWTAEGEDCDAGARVRVTGVDGIVLRVHAEGR